MRGTVKKLVERNIQLRQLVIDTMAEVGTLKRND